jgi:hypothetical protein
VEELSFEARKVIVTIAFRLVGVAVDVDDVITRMIRPIDTFIAFAINDCRSF